MSDNSKQMKKRMKRRPIWICAEVWLGIFPFLPPRQLGLRIALVSVRFDGLVDGHFTTRRWTFGDLKIRGQIGKDCGTKEMQIVKMVNSSWKPMPMPEQGILMPNGVVGFKRIEIFHIDPNVAAFLHRIRPLFGNYGINLNINPFSPLNTRFLERFYANIWPLIRGGIYGMELYSTQFDQLRSFSPTILRDCPSLKIVCCTVFPEFLADDSANASMEQAVAKWLCTPRGDGMPKVLKCMKWLHKFLSQIEGIKRAIADSSSPVNFIIVIGASTDSSIVPFDLLNEFTGKRLKLKRFNDDNWLLVHCPILRDEKHWAEWENEAIEWQRDDQWNKLIISVDDDDDIGNGPLDDANCKPGPSGRA